MKHIILILLLFSALASPAQKHLEFDGIPIDGTISAFTEKMKKAGYIVDPTSKRTPAGERYFYSVDYDGDICVKYDVRTRTVFAVIEVFTFRDATESWRVFHSAKKQLAVRSAETDDCGSTVIESADGSPFYGIVVYNSDCDIIGTITCRMEYYRPEEMYLVIIEFSDSANSKKYSK